MAITESRGSAEDQAAQRPLAARLGWLALIWCASVATLAGVALLIRVAMRAIGMST